MKHKYKVIFLAKGYEKQQTARFIMQKYAGETKQTLFADSGWLRCSCAANDKITIKNLMDELLEAEMSFQINVY